MQWRHLVTVPRDSDPMAVDGIDEHCRGKWEDGEKSVSKHQIQPEYGECGGLARNGTVEFLSQETKFSEARTGAGKIHFSLFNHKQDRQPYNG